MFTATLTSVKEMEGKKETPVLAACVISYGDGHRAKENDTGHLWGILLNFDNLVEMK